MPAGIAKPTSHESKETQKGHGQIGPAPEVGLGSSVKDVLSNITFQTS